MFYAHFVLSKKGPLARIWLAAHWDKKLTKAHVFETNIEGSVEAIIQPKVKLALRTSGHLLLGVVRIYSRKAKYLLADVNEAFVKIKMAFRPGVVDLPEENKEAAVAAITLPETFHDFESTMADLSDIDVHAQFSVNQSRPEEITMREDIGNIMLVGDDGFGDMGFGEKIDIDLPDGGEDYEGPAGMDDDDNDDHDVGDFGGGLDTGLFDNFGGGLFEENQTTLAATAPKTPAPKLDEEEEEVAADHDVGADFGELDTGLFDNLGGGLFGDPTLTNAGGKTPAQKSVEPMDEFEPPPQEQTTTSIKEQTTLISNEGDAFALEPIDITSLGTERKAKRRRKLVIDEQKGIPSETMKMQLSDTSEIVSTFDLAPPTKKLMLWKETGGVEKLTGRSERPLPSKKMFKLYSRNLLTKQRKEDTVDTNVEPPTPTPSIVPQIETTKQQKEKPVDTIEEPPTPSMESRIVAHKFETPEVGRVNTSSNLPMGDVSSINMTSANVTQIQNQTDLQLGDNLPLASRMSSDDEDNDDYGNDDDDFDIESQPSLDLNVDLQELPTDEDHQEPGETVDEFEERRWKGRSQQLMNVIAKGIKSQDKVSFHDMVAHNNRKQVASKFYTLLVLKKLQAVSLQQSEPFGDIVITQGPKL